MTDARLRKKVNVLKNKSSTVLAFEPYDAGSYAQIGGCRLLNGDTDAPL